MFREARDFHSNRSKNKHFSADPVRKQACVRCTHLLELIQDRRLWPQRNSVTAAGRNCGMRMVSGVLSAILAVSCSGCVALPSALRVVPFHEQLELLMLLKGMHDSDCVCNRLVLPERAPTQPRASALERIYRDPMRATQTRRKHLKRINRRWAGHVEGVGDVPSSSVEGHRFSGLRADNDYASR